MSELSHFEGLSAQTPKKEPYAILIGTALLVIVLVVINQFAPNQAVAEAGEEKEPDLPAVTAPDVADDGEEI